MLVPYASVRGIRLYYEDHAGDGPPLVVAHGLMGSVALMARFGERIESFAAKGLRVIAYDARGHGRSGYTTRRADYGYAALAADMHALIHALGIEPASVYGGSMGAGTAIACALAHPDAVTSLVLMSPPPFARDIEPARRTFGPLAVSFRLFGPKATARLAALAPAARRAASENAGLDLASFLAAQRRESIPLAIRALLYDEMLPEDRLGEIAQPALVLTHPDDPVHPLASGELLHERMPHARLAVAPSAAYWRENPEALAHVVSAFVRGETVARGLPERHRHQPDAPAR